MSSPAKAKGKKPAAAASPRKKEGKRPPLNDQKVSAAGKKPALPTLTAFAFHPDLPIEGYVYAKDDRNDAFLWGFKQVVDGTADCKALIGANFSSYPFRRIPNTPENAFMINQKDSYNRCILFRYVPEGTSSVASRTMGLNILKKFFMDAAFSKWPAPNILTMDGTNEDDPHALDAFFMDEEIEKIIKEEFDDEELDFDFYAKYPGLAKKLWSGTSYPDYAIQLGFPPLAN